MPITLSSLDCNEIWTFRDTNATRYDGDVSVRAYAGRYIEALFSQKYTHKHKNCKPRNDNKGSIVCKCATVAQIIE